MYVIGIDIGGMSIKGGIVDGSGNILAKSSVVTKQKGGCGVMAADIAGLIESILMQACLKISDISGIGIGSPGSIDSKRGVIVYSNNIVLQDARIVDELKKYIPQTPIAIANDANAAALGEVKFGEAKGYENVVFVTIGTGLGTGIIIDGKLFEGNAGAGAEGGHMVIEMDGEECTCGWRGCYEVYSSATGLVKQTKAAMEKNADSLMHDVAKEKGKVSGRTAFLAAEKGDEAAKAVLKKYIQYLGTGLVTFANIFRPDVILIGGGMSNEGDTLIRPLEEFVNTYAYGIRHGNPKVKVQKASLCNEAGILGAASLVI